MPAQWTGELVGEMHCNRISSKQLAEKLGYRTEYVSMILNGHREPLNAEERFRAAVDEIIKERENAE